MSRTARFRSRTLRGSYSGSIVRTYPPNPIAIPPQTTVVTSINLGEEVCQDYVGTPWADTTLTLYRGMAPKVVVNGVRSLSGFVYTTSGIPLDSSIMAYMRSPYSYASYFGRTPLDAITLTQMALANMNPNRPEADIGVDLLELREIPELLRDATDLLRHSRQDRQSSSAKAVVVAGFGIEPIIRDVISLFEFTRLVDKREKYLRELSSGFKRIKRKLTEEEWYGASPYGLAFSAVADENTSTNRARVVTSKATRTYWFSARAKLLDPISERDLRRLAAEVTYGVNTITAQQLWNIVPWSWLIDWFSTTGSLMAAYRGGLKWEWKALCLMHRTDYYMTVEFPSLRSGFTVTPLHPDSHATVKVRLNPVLFGLPVWRMPYLGPSQLSILFSLATLKIKGFRV